MENFTRTQILALRELAINARAYKDERITYDELRKVIQCLALVFSSESWDEGRHAIRKAIQTAGIFETDSEMCKVYMKMYDAVFDY